MLQGLEEKGNVRKRRVGKDEEGIEGVVRKRWKQVLEMVKVVAELELEVEGEGD